jgi:NitT/TauT family transport system permease protein
MTYHAPFVRSSLGTDSVLPHLLATTWRTVAGVLAGALTAIIVGLLLGWKENLYHFFELPIELLRTLPPLAYLPFLSLWFGPTNLAIFLLVFSGTFFMVIVNTITAIHNVDPIYSKFARTLGASDWHIYRSVIVPSIIPELTGGIRVILVYSWGITIAGELLGVKTGIGQVLMVLTTFSAVSQILATTLWVSLAAIFFDRAYIFLDRWLIRWKEIEF